MLSLIQQHHSEIAAICRLYGISRLDLVGSAARESDFNYQTSDVDFLVSFAPDTQPDLHSFFGAKLAFEDLLKRKVDLVEDNAVRNPYILADMNRHRQGIYATS